MNPTTDKKTFNVAEMFKYGLLGLLIGFMIFILVGLSTNSTPLAIIAGVIVLALFGFYGSRKKTKEQVEAEVVSKEGLSQTEKVLLWLGCLVLTPVVGAAFYYSWRKTHPTKARQANHISIIVFLIYLTIAVLIKAL